MATIAALALVLAGLVALAASGNAARPVIDPTRRYSTMWVPAMVVTELAPWLLVPYGVVLGAALGLGAWSEPACRIGIVMLVVAAAVHCSIVVRTWIGVRRLRPHVDGDVLPARGRARVVGRPAPTPPGVEETLGIEWSDGLTLDMARATGAGGALPVFVYVHGGGWTHGDPQHQARELYHSLAFGGWVVLAIRYPFAPVVTIEEQVESVRAVLRWVRRDLPRLGVSASRVAIGGGSAGGHLAAMAALTPTSDEERVDACVGIYGVYDMANRTPTRAHWNVIADTVMQATVSDAPGRYLAMSPIDRITDESPPFLLVHGTRDTLVPIGESRLFAEALRSARRPVELVEVYRAEHAFDAMSSITTRTTAAVIRTWLLRCGQAPTA